MTPHRLCPDSLCQILFDELGLSANVSFAVAYSGGCDSHVLLHLMAALRRRTNFGLCAVHFEHGIAPQSATWTNHCKAVCQAWDIPFITSRPLQSLQKTPGSSLEALARQSRYQWFRQVVERDQVLLTAHHANDQAETVLLNLLRGNDVDLLAGIPKQRMLSVEKSTQVIRPLLTFKRTAVYEYACSHKLTWIDDPSNQSLEFDRNYLRKKVLPLLEQRWHHAPTSLANSAQKCREVSVFLNAMAEPLLKTCRASDKKGVFCLASPLTVSELKRLGKFQIIRLIRIWLHQSGVHAPTTGQLETLYQQVFQRQATSACLSWGHWRICYFDGHLYLTGAHERCDDVLDWDLSDRNLGNNGMRIQVSRTQQGKVCHIDPQRLGNKSLRLIWRKGGERITLPGRKHSSTLKKLFQQSKILPWERNLLPLLTVDSEIAWVHGIGTSAAYYCDQNQLGIDLHISISVLQSSTN